MRIHYLQHVPFEGLANIEPWGVDKGHSFSSTRLFDGEKTPSVDHFDWLVVMGGPMNIHEDDKYPWLAGEKRFIEKSIDGGKLVLGVCLGAQLIADVLGGRVYRNSCMEIGWHTVTLTDNAKVSPGFSGLPESFAAFHWHGDTFDIPPGAMRIAGSEGCKNQAFEYGGRVVGLQFHLESSRAAIERLIENCHDEIVEGKYIQPAGAMLSRSDELSEATGVLNMLLDNMEALL